MILEQFLQTFGTDILEREVLIFNDGFPIFREPNIIIREIECHTPSSILQETLRIENSQQQQAIQQNSF